MRSAKAPPVTANWPAGHRPTLNLGFITPPCQDLPSPPLAVIIRRFGANPSETRQIRCAITVTRAPRSPLTFSFQRGRLAAAAGHTYLYAPALIPVSRAPSADAPRARSPWQRARVPTAEIEPDFCGGARRGVGGPGDVSGAVVQAAGARQSIRGQGSCRATSGRFGRCFGTDLANL